MALYKLYY